MVLTLQYGFTWCEICSKRLNYFSCFSAHDLEYLGPVSPKLSWFPKSQKTDRAQPCNGFKNLSKELFKDESWSWRCWITFHVFQRRLPAFPKLYYCPNYPGADENPPSDSLVSGLRLNFMRHIQLRILDYFACVPAYDLLCLDLVSPDCAMPQIPWSKYDLTLLVQLLHLSETSLDEKWGVKNFRLLFVYPCLRFRVFDPSI